MSEPYWYLYDFVTLNNVLQLNGVIGEFYYGSLVRYYFYNRYYKLLSQIIYLISEPYSNRYFSVTI